MNNKIKRLKVDFKASLLVIFLASILTCYFMIWLAPGPSEQFLTFCKEQPMLFLLNFLPILLIMLIIYFITGNSIFASIIVTALGSALAFANSTKIMMRQDPVVPSDLSVISELKAILVNFDPSYIKAVVIGLIVFVILCISSIIFFTHKESFTPKKRTIASAVTIVISVFIFTSAYSNAALYDSFEVDGNIYFKVNQYLSKGFVYSFTYDINNLKVDKPKNYNKTVFDNLDATADTSQYENTPKPNIVMVMSEAFSDISNADEISFDGYNEPLEFYNDFITRDDVISGHIVVPNFGGGTSDTEFDVLTGYSTRYINSSQVSYNLLNKKIDSIPGLLKDIGYDTLAIHPGFGWFYNRINVYNMLGFDEFQYLETSFEPQTQGKGGYISDAATTESIINNFEKRTTESDSPLFEFCVTIQNHGPYGEKYGSLEDNFSTDVTLTDEERSIYTGYFQGLDDADQQIEDLVTYFEKSSEPVVFVFFGDHLPGFSNGMTYFSQFREDIDMEGTIDQQIRVYETPYFIWANNAAKDITNFSENIEKIKMPSNNVISSSFLGTTLLELMDMGDISSFISYVNEVRNEVPVATRNILMNRDGVFSDEASLETQELLNKYSKWIYYKLFDDSK